MGNALHEQRAGGTQILQALEEMRSITAQVKDGSHQMAEGNAHILDAAGRLNELTTADRAGDESNWGPLRGDQNRA